MTFNPAESSDIFPIEWANEEKTIFLVTLLEAWTMEVMVKTRQQANVLREQVNHIVHSIIDVRKSGHLPTDFLMGFPDLNRLEHPYSGIAVWVAKPETILLKELLQIYGDMFDIDIPVVPTVEEAFRFISDHAEQE